MALRIHMNLTACSYKGQAQPYAVAFVPDHSLGVYVTWPPLPRMLCDGVRILTSDEAFLAYPSLNANGYRYHMQIT